MFSIYAVGIKKGYRRETRVKLHAVVDFRNAPALGQTGARRRPNRRRRPRRATPRRASRRRSRESAGADAIAAANMPSTGGQIVYFRVSREGTAHEHLVGHRHRNDGGQGRRRSAPRTGRCSSSGSRASRSCRPAASPRRSRWRRAPSWAKAAASATAIAIAIEGSQRDGQGRRPSGERARSRSARSCRSSSRRRCRSTRRGGLRLSRASRTAREEGRGARRSRRRRQDGRRRERGSTWSKSALGVEPERVGIGAFPIANLVAVVPALAEGIVAVVDLGTVSSDVVILVERRAAVRAHRRPRDQGPPGTAPKLARELRTTIAAHRAQGGEPPTRVLLCGGGAYVSGAEAFLSSALELPVEELAAAGHRSARLLAPEHARDDRALREGDRPRARPRSARASASTCGRGPLAFERGMAWVKETVPLLAGLAAVILVSFLFSAWAQLYAKSKEKAVLEAALGDGLEGGPRRGDDERRAREGAARVADRAQRRGSAARTPTAFDVMVKLSEQIPPSMTHDIEELDIQKKHVIVHGIVGTSRRRGDPDERSKSERCFADPKITRTTQMVGEQPRRSTCSSSTSSAPRIRRAARRSPRQPPPRRRARRPPREVSEMVIPIFERWGLNPREQRMATIAVFVVGVHAAPRDPGRPLVARLEPSCRERGAAGGARRR